MKRMTNILLAVLAVTSCTVKEDRTDCPCWLEMTVKDNTELCRSMTFTAWTTDKVKEEEVDLTRYTETYETTVPRDIVTTCLYSGITRGEARGSEYHITKGQDADSLYSCSGVVDCTGETARTTVVLKKNFARVFLKMTAPEGEGYPYSVIVRSDVSGMDLITGRPINGQFEHQLRLDTQHQTTFALPRQPVDNKALIIDLYKDNKIIYTIPLGEQIAQMGYDWEDLNLKDIYIGVDYAEASVEISILGWKSDNFEIIV